METNTPISTINNRIFLGIFLLFALFSYQANAQLCGGSGCASTDYANFGFNSNNNPATIEYDNFVSAFHSTVIRTSDGKFQVWGANSTATGGSNYTPSEVNNMNFPLITNSTPLKVTIGSSNIGFVKFTLLTTDGLYNWGKNNTAFAMTKEAGTGLPTGVNPLDVKSMTRAYRTLSILTCSGDVWVRTETVSPTYDLSSAISANAGAGAPTAHGVWYRVTINAAGDPLQGVVALRMAYQTLFALKSDGSLWTWGNFTYKGDGVTAMALNNRAIEMTKPKSSGTIKMIGITQYAFSGSNSYPTYYVLYTDGNLYSLGQNSHKQLGDWVTATGATNTSAEVRGWVQPRYSSGGQVMNNIKWISSNDHDKSISAINVINNNGTLYNWGDNHARMLGRPATGIYDPGIPGGLTATDKILSVNTGGHTTMAIKLNEPKMGYVGHYVEGSAGNGFTNDATFDIFQFVDTQVKICGLATPFVQNISGCGTLDLNTAIQGTNVTPSDAVIRWFNGDNPATATQITNITAVAPGTYYAFYYYASTTSYSAASLPVAATTAGAGGSVAPIINDGSDYIATNSAYYIACGNTTANLSALTASNKPAPASVLLTWHSATPATAANRINPVTAVTGATRKIYAAFWDNVALCYSPTKEITIYASICATNDTYGVVATNSTTTLSVLANDTFNGSAATLSNVSLSGTAIPAGITLNPNGTVTIANTTLPGNYQFSYTICDLTNTSLCKTANVSLTISKDTDGDGVVDIYDLDDDNDGILDINESPSCYSCTLGTTNTWTSYQTFSTDATLLPPAVDESATFGSQNPETIITTKFPNTDPFGFGMPWYNSMVLKSTNNAFGTIDELSSTTAHSEWHVNMAIWQPTVMANQPLRLRTNNNGFYSTPVGKTETSKLFAMVNDGTAPMLSASAAIDANYNEINLGNWNGTSCVILALHMFDQSLAHDNAIIEYWTGTAWVALPPSAVAPMPARIVGCTNDADGDGIPNHLDLDSDNDGCTDAIEGAGNFTTLSTSTMPGGNTGATSGTFNQPVVQNLGNVVDNNPTSASYGVPTIAGTGQAVGTSKTANPVLVSGTASANQLIISGTAPAALTLTGSTGTIQWQVSTDNITFNNVASAGTTASYSPGTLTATRYYRALVTSAGGCTATSNVVKIAVCAAGSVAPVFNDYINGGVQIYSKINSAYSIQCAGGAQTANLIVLVASPVAPVGTSVTWHSATPATDANRINPVTAVTGATRKVYAAFWDSSNSCYSPTKEITIYGPICATDDNFTATPILYGVATTLPISITANDTYLGATIGAPNPNVSIAWEIGNSAVVVNANGTLTFNTTAPTLQPGTYTYLYKICDLDPDAVVDSNCAWAEVTFKIISCTNPPNTNPSTDFTKTGISDIAGFEGGAVGWPGNVPNGFIAIESRNKGFVITRVASTSVITNPVLGMLVYDMSNSPAPCVKLYSDLGWNCLAKDCLPAATKN